MLDVDGHVISPDALLERVQQLVSTIDGQSPAPPVDIRPCATEQLAAPVHAMQPLHEGLRPPDLSGAAGLRGRAGRFFKRVDTPAHQLVRGTTLGHSDRISIFGISSSLER